VPTVDKTRPDLTPGPDWHVGMALWLVARAVFPGEARYKRPAEVLYELIRLAELNGVSHVDAAAVQPLCTETGGDFIFA
jgi:hypothetical protein